MKGPMQSWGDSSRYRVRGTGSTPSKSAIVGLLAAAQGRRRTDPVEDLTRLKFAVRIDQSGTLLHDYQTAQDWQRNPGSDATLITRTYLTDAVFLVGIEAPDRALLESLAENLRNPIFPLYLGRRSCPAPVDLVQGIVDLGAAEALMAENNWFATPAHKRERSQIVRLPIYRDGEIGEKGAARRDVPLSFDPKHRKYGWREVIYAGDKEIENPTGTNRDPFFEVVISS
nr:type I-E CRISPR-associated protein Cas5/CasD [Corynebacterium sp. 76QC2CO]